jgi:hypothetical protein
MAFDFAEAAIQQGVAVDREIRGSDLYRHIATMWYLIGKITFDCPIGTLINAQYIIEAAKVDGMANGEVADLTNATSVTCFNLAAALIIYFGNDVKFWE